MPLMPCVRALGHSANRAGVKIVLKTTTLAKEDSSLFPGNSNLKFLVKVELFQLHLLRKRRLLSAVGAT